MSKTRVPADKIRTELHTVFGKRFRAAILYGSEARGDARPDSDIDILVLLDGPIELWKDIQTALNALYPLILSLGRPISCKPIDIRHYQKASCPLYENAKREGIAL